MLANEVSSVIAAGQLDLGARYNGEWLRSIIAFIHQQLPAFRDDPERPRETHEDKLTSALCTYLTLVSRHLGFDMIHFKREEKDEADARRSIDLSVAPLGTIIWIEERRYSQYQTMLPIECKRLPTPKDANRDHREYVVSDKKSTGGIQRFKNRHHGSDHDGAVMIAYIQDDDIPHWIQSINRWIEELAKSAPADWEDADQLCLISHELDRGTCSLTSMHRRGASYEPIRLAHLWVEM